jgi:two-component system sensor histidine kinase AgrC
VTFLRMFCGCMLQLVPFALLSLYPFKNHYRLSVKKVFFIALALIVSVCLTFAAICTQLRAAAPPEQDLFYTANAIFMCCLVPCFLYFLVIVKDIWQRKIFVFLFSITAALTMTSIGTIIETWLQLEDAGYDGLPYYGTTMLTLALLTIVFLPLFWLMIKKLYMPVADALSKQENGHLTILSLLLFIVLAIILIPLDYSSIYNPVSMLLYIALTAAVFIIYAVCFSMLSVSHKNLEAQEKLIKLDHYIELRDEQYKRLTESIENSRRQRHDMRHHVIALQGLLNSGNMRGATDYLKQYLSLLEKDENTPIICENALLNTVIGYYASLANTQSIHFAVKINVPKSIDFPDTELAVIIGNLLENALTAADRASDKQRFINVNVMLTGKMLVLTVDNGFDGKVALKDGRYRSLKDKHVGIGLSSIENVAEKYDGGVEFSHDDNVFHASVMLNLKENQ